MLPKVYLVGHLGQLEELNVLLEQLASGKVAWLAIVLHELG